MTESVEYLVLGAGPGGLRAAQVLAEAGREVLVLERNAEVGPKTCGGGLTLKAVSELSGMGLPLDAGRTLLAHAEFAGHSSFTFHPVLGAVRTLSRRALGAWQLGLARQAGAQVRTESAATDFDFDGHTLQVNRASRIRYRHLIAADGSRSSVRRALGLPTPRAFFAAEYNIPGRRDSALSVRFDSDRLGTGYFWVFPHTEYTSYGAGAYKHAVVPRDVCAYIEKRLASMGVDPGETPLEAFCLECDYRGWRFGDVSLVGDAAGLVSPLTGEGIYAALVSGEEAARSLIEPRYPLSKTRGWLRRKRAHEFLWRRWQSGRARSFTLATLIPLFRVRPINRGLTAFFLS